SRLAFIGEFYALFSSLARRRQHCTLSCYQRLRALLLVCGGVKVQSRDSVASTIHYVNIWMDWR
ncbi:MAG: hypothetical protein QMD04_11545, partial [Anaerolineales bacterium]|nr:hypothetical protein [Anaerolineales bacterium]